MINSISKWLWKRREAKRLAGDARGKETLSIYADDTIKEIERVIELESEPLKLLTWEKNKLEGDKTITTEFPSDALDQYHKDRRVKEIEKQIAAIDEKVVKHSDNLSRMKTHKAELERQAEELWKRRTMMLEKY